MLKVIRFFLLLFFLVVCVWAAISDTTNSKNLIQENNELKMMVDSCINISKRLLGSYDSMARERDSLKRLLENKGVPATVRSNPVLKLME